MSLYSCRASWIFRLLVAIILSRLTWSLNLHWISPRQGSIAGGTTVLVVGSGFATDQYTGQNFVFFGDVPCIVQGYTVSSTRLECVTQPYPGSFEGSSSHWLQARIISKGKQYQSNSWVTRFRYNWGYTPQIRDIIPPSGPVNSLIEIGGYRFSSDIANRFTYMFLGDQICNFWDENGDVQDVYGGRWYYNYYIKCLVKQQTPGAWNASAFMTGYSGMTWNHSQAMKLGFDGKLSMFELYPDIHNVQPSSGGVLGGTLVTIKGTGFGIKRPDIKLEVDVDGMPCEVTEHSQTEIKCWTRKPDDAVNNDSNNVTEGYRYMGSRGTSLRHFTSSSLSGIDDLYNKIPDFPLNPDKVALLPSFSSSSSSYSHQYGARYMAFFTPVQSGKHTFFIRADDWAILYLTEGKNIKNLTEIARVNSHNSWNGNTADYSNARSDSLYLKEGNQYLLVGDMVEVYGADFLRVGVLMHETKFLHNETTQSVRERQLIAFESHGHYDIQNVYIELNTSALMDSPSTAEFELKWGSRSKTITAQELINDEDMIAKAVMYLLKGVCNFQPQTGVYYSNQAIYDFETVTSTDDDPLALVEEEYVKDTSYCGYQSLLVAGQVIILDPEVENAGSAGFLSSNYPILCMAYKIPPDVHASVIIYIEGIGWQSLSLTSHGSEGTEDDTGDDLGHWSDAVSADDIITDNMWHHGCTDIHSLIVINTDSDLLGFTVTGFGFESGSDEEYFVDAVSFTSAPVTIQNHLAPAKPNGISVHQLVNNTLWEWKENDTVLSVNVTLEVIPTSCDHDIPLISLQQSVSSINNTIDDDPGVIMYGSQRLQHASESIKGTYQLGFDGSWTDPIDYFSEPTYIRDALNALPTVSGYVNAWYRTETLPQDKLGNYCPGRELVVRFDRVPGDNPLLVMNSSNLTGHGLEVDITEIETGGLFLYPIPGHMLQTVETTPQVHIRINNQLAACGGGSLPSQYSATYTNPCGFSYNDSLTPTVTSLSPTSATTGDIITVTGQGFSDVPTDNFVLFGDIQCDVTQATDTSITCSLGKGQAGVKNVWVHVLSSSVAVTDGVTLEYSLTVQSLDPSISGTGGGIELTVSGDGFVTATAATVGASATDSIGYSFSGYESIAHDNGGCTSWRNKVLIGGNECEINAFSSSVIKCIVPPAPLQGSYDVTVSVYCADDGSTVSHDTTFPTQFTYDDALQPTMVSITPSTGSGRGGETVSITGTGFTTVADDVTVYIGGAQCVVSMVTDVNIDCVTSPHSHGTADVVVTVAQKGNALGNVEYEYQLEVTSISKCTGSLFGGQLIVVKGSGFGSTSEGVDMKIGSYSCSIESITNTEISCFSGSTATTHQITNNDQNSNYGLGYSWDNSDINITIGDSIEWKWTGSAFTPLKRIVEVESDSSNTYNGHGFASDKAIRGSFTHTFSSPGVHYYVMEGYGHIGFRGKVTVQSYSDLSFPLSISFDSVKPYYGSVICGQTLASDSDPVYSYLVSETPTISISTPPQDQLITAGSDISISVQGMISLIEHNVLTIGGKPCTSSTHTSTTITTPSLQLPPAGTYTYSNGPETITCTIPDIYPGDYRLMLHVSGRGWAFGDTPDTTVSVRASIRSDYVTVNGSLAGGTILSIPVTGIDRYIIGQTNVYIGNTPCLVQDVNTTGTNPLRSEVTCITNTPWSDGYSALISDTALCYWSLQYDLYNSLNQKYGVENSNFFRSAGKLTAIPANVVGSVEKARPGISGDIYRDQSAYFSSSYLSVDVFERYLKLTSFSFELWFKGTSSSIGKYAILASSFQRDDEYAKGFIVAINPCNQIEFWLGTGQKPLNNDSCYVNMSNCEYHCSNGQTVEVSASSSIQNQMPEGVWSVVRTAKNEFSNMNWNHLVFGFEAKSEQSGAQRLYLNTKLSKADNVSYDHQTNESDITFGGSDILHTKASLPGESQVHQFVGHIDEIGLFEYMLSPEDINEHYIYGTTGQQPIVISTELIDGVGKGTIPDLEIESHKTTFDDLALEIKLNDVSENTYSISQKEAVHIKWTGLHGLYQVKLPLYEDCLKDDIDKVWSPPRVDGSLIVWLESGFTYYFIDAVGNNCLNGIKFQISVGSITVVDWSIGDHEDINIMEGDGVLFKWQDAVPHNLIEMTSPESVTEQCMYVGEKAKDMGKVKKEWKSVPEVTGEVVVSDLSVGLHYFVCSVGSHCTLGMRVTVNVSSQGTPDTDTDEDSGEHLVPWYVPSVQYETLNIFEGESIVFAWNAFHSLHQVSESTYEACDTSSSPLYKWARPSVDNSVKISHLSAGTYYYICSVSGHCDAGMKLKVKVNERHPNVIHDPVSADCEAKDDSLCSFSYNGMTTPSLLNVEPSTLVSGGNIRLNLTNYNLVSMKSIGDSVDDLITVLIGTHPCLNVLFDSFSGEHNILSCTTSNEQQAGSYEVKVYVKNLGFAGHSGASLLINSNYITVSVTATLTSVSPSTGSINGGTLITLTGTGFSHITQRMEVYVGEHQCDIVKSTTTDIECITGPATLQTTLLPVSVHVGDSLVSAPSSYTYTTDQTPTITSISPVNGLEGGMEIVISGDKYGTVISDVTVQLLNSKETFYHSSAPVEVLCNVKTVTATTITCDAPYRSAGVYSVSVHVKGKGLSIESSLQPPVIYQLAVEQVNPTHCGHGGGVLINVTGSGFPTQDNEKENTDIKVCSSACEVVDVFSEVLLSCMLQGSGVSDPSIDTSCTVVISYNNLIATSTQNLTYSSTLTPTVASVSPDSGGTAGGTYVTITGQGLLPIGIDGASLQEHELVITFDGAICEWFGQAQFSSPNNTVVMCRTSDHRLTVFAEINVFVDGKGNALIQDGLVYQYVDRWSSVYTWGGLPPPLEGESVYIKEGQTVFLDTDTPVLNLILIEGELIFEDEQDVHLQAKYIFINNGKLQIGTEDNPFTHNATVTLHGHVNDPEIPIYGAKVIGIRQGELDIHGRKRAVTWTRLSSTAMKNSSTLELQESVDWNSGDEIVIAPTGKEGNETETSTIDYVSDDGHTVYLTMPLAYTHYGITEVFENGASIDIRAEVGLLSHNVVIEGSLDDDGEFDGKGADQYGVQIMIHRTGPHPTPIRIENTEVRYAGQAFRLGRYAIHFHLSGNMSGSYVRNCAIHHSNNRALTAHGVHNLLVQGNVAYDIRGHAFFVEDGIETNNRYLQNFGVYIRSSSSLLNTDQIPAVFWITNPNNVFIGNAAAASRAYGFWYDLDNSPSGPSYTASVCPNKEMFGEFSDNTAHSCNEFGLRIWETYFPHADGCNSKIQSVASLYNFTTYANDIHGIEFSVIGNVKIIGFKVADNRDNGIEIQETNGEWEQATIEDTLIVSHTSINNGSPGTGGIRTPNTRGLKVSNVTFANFNLPSTACLRACSHCKPLQGGFQVSLEKLHFIGNSSLYKAYFQWEHEVLFHDLDGSLSGQGNEGWVLPDSNLHPPQYCTKSVPEFSVNKAVPGSICSSDVYFVRMAWNEAKPIVTLQGIAVNVSNEFGSSIVLWKHYRLTHMDGYMMTVPSRYTHLITWQLPSSHLIDVMSYSAGLYSLRPSDYVVIGHDFVQSPDHVNIGGNRESEETMVQHSDPNLSWYMNNITDSVYYLISGVNTTDEMLDKLWKYSYEPCPVDGCPQPPDPNDQPLEETQRRWSDVDSWPNKALPVEGDNVLINSTWRMLLDVSPPPLGTVTIAGELEFENVRNYNFTAKTILIRGPNAHLIIGSESLPFIHNAIITLTGKRNDQPISLSSTAQLGSKAIGIFGNVTMFGKPNSHTWTTLDRSCSWNDSVIYLKDSPDWLVGDEIVISSSSYEASEAEIRTIVDYDATSGKVTLNEALKHNHEVYQLISDVELESDSSYKGTWWWTGSKEDITVSPEVGLLSHNIIIQGGDDPDEPLNNYHYGCRILVGEYTTNTLYTYTGTVTMDSVEIRHCGQGGYFSPIDPRYSLVFKDIEDSESVVSRSSVHHGYNTGIGIHGSSGVTILDSVVYRTTGSSIICGGSGNIVEGNLALMTSTVQPNVPSDNHAVDFPATFDINRNNIVRNNAAGGSNRIAFRYTGQECDDNREPITGETAQFWNNSAHSGLIGMVILGLPSDCSSVSGFTAHHHWDYAVFSSSPSSVSVSHMKLAIGKVGFNLNIFGPNPVAHLIGQKSIRIINSLIVGFIPQVKCATTQPSNAIPGVSLSLDTVSAGIMMSSFNQRRSKMDGTAKWHLMKGYPTVDGKAETIGVTFAHFIPPTDCPYSSVLVINNPLSPDAVHPLDINNVIKIDVAHENLVHFYDPDPKWIVQEDCVDMDCDGPKHALIRDTDGSFSGSSIGSIVARAELRFDNYSSRIPLTWLDFEDSVSVPQDVVDFRGIYRGNPYQLSADKSCEWMDEWNGYRCHGLDHLMFIIESMDSDTETRRVSPVALVGTGPEAEYTDLLNGPMDHGWCTYYTCLKRLSTFFSVVSTGIDYHIWMTGSLPGSLRLHLLNSNANQAIRVNIWYKDPRRKDIYKNGIFIESSNTKFLENGAVTQLDGDYLPSFDTFSGANYFDKQTQILSILVKGPDIIEIKTPPVVQISLTVAVSLDEFFIQNLISNLAYVLKIDVSRIRVVNIIAEDSIIDNSKRRVRSAMSNNTISLELGDPPRNNTDPPKQTSSEADWLSGKGENDNVDIKNDTKAGSVPSGNNPFNEETPETSEDFVAQYNQLANLFEEEIQEYNDVISKVNEVNKLGASVIDLVQTGGLEEFSINAISAVLAPPPAMPDPPLIPPEYINVTLNTTMINTTDLEDFTSQFNTTSTYTVPTRLIIEREPSSNSGHLVYVIVSIRDNNGGLVTSLGFLNNWKCVAKLITDSSSKLEGETEVAFEDGIATFTRLRVDQPSSKLRLAFITNPGSLRVNSSVIFTVHEPTDDTDRKMIVLILVGDTSILASINDVVIMEDIKRSLSHTLDIDYSRIRNMDYVIMSDSHLQITFDILDNTTTDPPNVPSLTDAINTLQDLVFNTSLTVVINGSSFLVLNDSLDILPPVSRVGDPTLIIISTATICSCIILSMLAIALIAYCVDYRKAAKKNKISSAPNNDFHYQGFNEDAELNELRNLRIPRASITQPHPHYHHRHHPSSEIVQYHPNSAEPWIIDTSLRTLNNDSQYEDTDSLASIEMPRIPRPSFSRLPSSIQLSQSKTLASF